MGTLLNPSKASYSKTRLGKKNYSDPSKKYTTEYKEIDDIQIEEEMSMEEISDLISDRLFKVFIKSDLDTDTETTAQ